MGDKYAVDYESASAVADTTTTAVNELAAVTTSATDALTAAKGAVPTNLGGVIAILESISSDHKRDLDTMKGYASDCVTSLSSCLAIYEHTSAEMVAEQAATERSVVFEHGSIFGNTEKQLNSWLDGKADKAVDTSGIGKDAQHWNWGQGGGYTSTGSGSTTYSSSTTGDHGYTETTTSTTATENGRTTVSSKTVGSVTDWNERLTSTDYQGRGFDAATGGNETSASGSETKHDSGGSHSKTSTGRTDVPVAR